MYRRPFFRVENVQTTLPFGEMNQNPTKKEEEKKKKKNLLFVVVSDS